MMSKSLLLLHQVLANIKEKLYWSQVEVGGKREQLAALEATMARRRNVLGRTKQVCERLQRDNKLLKEERGLLGNRALLQDLGDTLDASRLLEKRVENLKEERAELLRRGGREKRRVEMTL